MSLCLNCGCEILIGMWWTCDGSGDHKVSGGTLLSAIHTSERSVIYRNPKTGEHRTPARADQPIPEVYARQGYVREELRTHADVQAFEKSTGLIHERSHYNPGSGRAERDLIGDAEKPLPIRGLDAPTTPP